MDPVGIGLALFSIFLFAVTLSLSTRPAQSMRSDIKKIKLSGKPKSLKTQKTIAVKLPRAGDIPEGYTLDLKFSLSKGKKEGEEEKGNVTGQRLKKFYRRLDEYF